MVIDSSALIAILNNESEAESLTAAIGRSDLRLLSAVNWVETAIVIETRYGPQGVKLLDNLIEEGGILVEPVSLEQAASARQAYTRFGKGRHPAALNFGDCFAYALADVNNDLLLFKGDDFSQTDISIVTY